MVVDGEMLEVCSYHYYFVVVAVLLQCFLEVGVAFVVFVVCYSFGYGLILFFVV